MSDSKQFQSLPVLTEVSDQRELERRKPTVAAVRVSPGPYLAIASVITFLSALLLRSDHNAYALALIATGWSVIPVLALTDRIAFDGSSIRRQGPIAFLLYVLFRQRKQLAVNDFETVETHAVRTLRRGGSVRYRYRTQINGKGKEFVIASGGKGFRRLVRELFPLIHGDKMDSRSLDLRDYLSEPALLKKKARLSKLASSDILDVSKTEFRAGDRVKGRVEGSQQPSSPEDIERSHLLRRLGNELRISGRLREGGEAFRRALNVSPRGAWLIYDFARLLRSQASAQSDARLLTRARAALRLASMRANKDIVLLPLIGETFLEFGDTRLARNVLQKAVDVDSGNFKARLGLADLALRDGKLAHVIHHFHEAARVSSEPALTRYARREAEYYMLLNDDDDYLSTELRRINWLQNVTRVRRFSSRVTNVSVLVALIGGLIDPVAGSIGWSLASSALFMWLLSLLGTRMLVDRSRPRTEPA
jgi:tetratricopeptide (TPR) repeat protein